MGPLISAATKFYYTLACTQSSALAEIAKLWRYAAWLTGDRRGAVVILRQPIPVQCQPLQGVDHQRVEQLPAVERGDGGIDGHDERPCILVLIGKAAAQRNGFAVDEAHEEGDE